MTAPLYDTDHDTLNSVNDNDKTTHTLGSIRLNHNNNFVSQNLGPSPHLTTDLEDDEKSIPESSSVQVAVRLRPLLRNEAGATTCIDVQSGQPAVRIGGRGGPTFTFDHVLPISTTQAELYSSCVVPLVQACLKGYNATVLAYGQTGSGKTHTIVGSSIQDEIYTSGTQNPLSSSPESSGMIPRAFRYLFQYLAAKKAKLCSESKGDNSSKNEETNPQQPQMQQPFEYEIRIQFLELYGEEIRDLLSPAITNNRLTIRDGAAGVEPEVIGATETTVHSTKEALQCLERGTMRRVTAATQMNTESSRSHAIMSVTVEQRTLTKSLGENNDDEVSREEIKRSKFHFVDLAGSERQKRTKAEGQRLKEGIEINKGLLVLGNVISALGDSKKVGRTHVPYRDSKLTRLLKGSLGGNHKTLMIACVSPASVNMEESLNCLRYANRAKNIQNNAVINLDAQSRLVSDLKGKCKALAEELLRVRDVCKKSSNGININIEEGSPFSQKLLIDLALGKDRKISKTINAKNTYDKENNETRGNEYNSCTTKMERPSLPTISDDASQNELTQLRQNLLKAKQQVSLITEQYFTCNAEKEYYRVQLPDESPTVRDITSIYSNNTGADSFISDDIVTNEADRDCMIPKQVFVSKVAEYEKEIAALKKAMREDRLAIEMNSTPQSKSSNTFAQVQFLSKESSDFDDEEDVAEREVGSLTKKYLEEGDFDTSFGADMNNLNDSLTNHEADISETLAEMDKSYLNRKHNLDEHISHLTKNISEKEGLVQQLNASQDKYEVMRSFYEEKLQQMEHQVKTREQEREIMRRDLKKIEKDKNSTAKNINQLQMNLQTKDKRISQLRRQQTELTSLTNISTRNLSVIQRLKQDISDMKRKKIELQRQVMSERKAHSLEVQKLKKEATFKDKEVVKWKHESHKKSSDASNAKRIAKSRLNEISMLRSKYKDAEKKLRKQTVKRGALARAGVDSAMVGRSDISIANTKVGRQINVDHLRNFLLEKVTDVGKMEMIAEKIANEWEEHLELMSRKENVLDESFKTGEESLDEDLEALDVQITYKEARIRKLTRKLGAKPFVKNKTNRKQNNPVSFLDDKEFKALSTGMSPLTATQSACKVLFGMVVRERRRVANLARTACNLDIKIYNKEKLLQSKDAAFRSYIEEENAEHAKMARQHQEDILSLMTLVKNNEESNGTMRTEDILASGGLRALESEVRALCIDRDEKLFYKREAEEAKNAVKQKEFECQKLEEELKTLNTMMKEVGLKDRNQKVEEKDLCTKKNEDLIAIKQKSRSSIIEMLESSDEDVEGPDWAEDIMADLVLIAEGEMPPSLQNPRNSPNTSGSESPRDSVGVNRSTGSTGGDSVFDRLADPHNFTGVQKQRQNSAPNSSAGPPSSTRERKNINYKKKMRKSPPPSNNGNSQYSRKSQNSPSSERNSEGSGTSSSSSRRSYPPSKKGKKSPSNSVYERLQDPSNFTGTQKAIFESNGKRARRRKNNQKKKKPSIHEN